MADGDVYHAINTLIDEAPSMWSRVDTAFTRLGGPSFTAWARRGAADAMTGR